MSQSWHLEQVKNAASFGASRFFLSCPCRGRHILTFPKPPASWLWLCVCATFACVSPSLLYQPELHLCVTSLHLDWSVVLVGRSAAGLGQLHRSDPSHSNPRRGMTLLALFFLYSFIWILYFLPILRSRLRHLWGGLVQSQLLHHPQVLHHLHPHLLLFHPRDDHALLLRLHYQNGEKHKRHVRGRLPHRPPKEGGERCHTGGFQFLKFLSGKTTLQSEILYIHLASLQSKALSADPSIA